MYILGPAQRASTAVPAQPRANDARQTPDQPDSHTHTYEPIPSTIQKIQTMRDRHIVNRLFAAEEGRLEQLMETLDHNVTVIDLR